MTQEIEQRLKDLGLVLPEPAAAAGSYAPFVVSGTTLYISGQLPMEGGVVAITGKVGGDVSIEDATRAARLAALNILAQAKAAADGDWDRLRRCVKLGGFVNAAPGFRIGAHFDDIDLGVRKVAGGKTPEYQSA